MRPSVKIPASAVETDVLVIGAGPSGLLAALALARLGIRVHFVERRAPGSQYGNADGLQPRTLEIWKNYDILDGFSLHAAYVHAMVAYEQSADGIGLVRTTPSRNVVVSARYGFEMAASISTIEATLRNAAEEAGADFFQPVAPASLDISDQDTEDSREKVYPIKVLLRPHFSEEPTSLSQGTRTMDDKDFAVHAKYVIGADGAHSWVRRHLSIQMHGDQTEHVWGVIDAIVDTNFPDCRFKCIIQSSTGALIIIPREGEMVRIYVQLPSAGATGPKGSFETPESTRAKILKHIVDGLAPYRIEFKEVFWHTIFSVPQKVASSYSLRDRIFIVGDACHTHSPGAGQGANASMGDSHNLAWKLAYVLRGWASRSLLDTYEQERRTYAQELIDFDKQIMDKLHGGTAEDYQSMLHKRNMFTSGIGIRYQSRLTSLGSELCARHLDIGERLPPSLLVRLGDWHPTELQDLVPADGLFKLFIFPSDILLATQNERLTEFAISLVQCGENNIFQRMSIYIIVDSPKEKVHWKDVPHPFQCWRSVFVSDIMDGSRGVYGKFGISHTGSTVLVRPDGYISMITELSGTGFGRIATFLQGL
ncbi:Phenol 2-monooxygenase [Hypsizygus marmoreus]|uniref:Phenol 2-monooxygenase n=1 Tax=Hypsizygus marmoreus TaxID=39966 RepID=A0A369K2T6_HYPMA|nr:Phenol 2-monooxygenase [Hypsizygus marmoreus]